MNKFFKITSVIVVGAGLFISPKLVKAQELSLRLEPGVAVPFTEPQSDRFPAGGYLAVKPELSLGPYFGLGPSVSVMVFPSAIEGVDPPAAWLFGVFGRVKRPHDQENNPDEGLAAVSPWLDVDWQYVNTGGLSRFGWDLAVGAALPVTDERNFWMGPFVRYQNVYQDDDKLNRNTNDSNTFIFGVSFEVGESHKKVALVSPPKEVLPVPEVKPTPVDPPVTYVKVDVELTQTIQFAWDSSILDNSATQQLDEVVKKLTTATSFKEVRVEGHASSEGQVKHNDKLAQARADSVLEYLVSHGLPREKLSAVGFGSRMPVADNKTEAGRVLNRRSEFVVNFVILKEIE